MIGGPAGGGDKITAPVDNLSGGSYLRGDLARMTVYAVALTAAQIQAQYARLAGLAFFAEQLPADQIHRNFGTKQAAATSWKVGEKAAETGDPAAEKLGTAALPAPRLVGAADGRFSLAIGPGASHRGATAAPGEAIALADNQEFRLPVQRLDREVKKGWSACFLELVNSAGHAYIITLGDQGKGYISRKDPDWRSWGHEFQYSLPAVFRYRREHGQLSLYYNQTRIFNADEPAQPFERFNAQLSLQHPDGSLLLEAGPLEVYVP